MKRNLIVAFILASITSFAQSIVPNDSIPMTINEQNTMLVKVIFNETDTLNLNFDTGTTEINLTNNTLKNKLKISPKLYNVLYNLKIGNINYKTKVYDCTFSGYGADGNFGWDFFKSKIVELNYDLNLMIVHSTMPKSVQNNSKFTKLKMIFFKDLFLVESKIKQNGVTNEDLFLFDTGYNRTVMLDNDLLKEGKFPTDKMNVIKKVIMKGSKGNEIPIITSNLKTLKIGKYKLKNVPVQLLTTNKPLKDKNTHILGNEVLKRFTMFLDFQENIVYMKPNHLFDDTYVDQKKKEI